MMRTVGIPAEEQSGLSAYTKSSLILWSVGTARVNSAVCTGLDGLAPLCFGSGLDSVAVRSGLIGTVWITLADGIEGSTLGGGDPVEDREPDTPSRHCS